MHLLIKISLILFQFPKTFLRFEQVFKIMKSEERNKKFGLNGWQRSAAQVQAKY